MHVSHLSFPIVSTQGILNMSRSHLLFIQWLSKHAYLRLELSAIVLHSKIIRHNNILEYLNMTFYDHREKEDIPSLFLTL